MTNTTINKEKNFISAVVYVHNAESHIQSCLKTLLYVLDANFSHSEIICVNDNSSDHSMNKIKEIAETANGSTISVINMSYYHGLELAMNAGSDLAIGDFVFEFDSATLDYDPSEIMNVYKKALEGYDIVSASPNKPQKLTSKLFYKIFDKFSDGTYKMQTERFRILSRRVLNRINNMTKTIPYRKAIYANCGLKTTNITYDIPKNGSIAHNNHTERRYQRHLALDSLILFTDVGYRFSITMTIAMVFMTVFMAAYSLIIYLTSAPLEGWTTTILFLSAAFFALFGILTIIIKYLQIIVNLVFRRKQYSFESIEKLTK